MAVRTRSRRGRALVVAGLGAALLAAAAVVWGPDVLGGYTHRLERYDNEKGEPNRYTNLPDGEAQLSFGSPDGHRLVVQWRDPDGHGWTSPEEVYDDPSLIAIDSTVRMAGGTVAIVETYTRSTSEDSDIGDVDVLVTCRDRTCTPGRRIDGYATEPELTPDGTTVLYGFSRKGAITWREEGGYSTWPWDGIDLTDESVSAPVLAPDGSLRAVRGDQRPAACRYTLLTSEPGGAAFTESAATSAQLPGRRRSQCDSYLDTFSSDWVGVEPYDHSTDHFWFVRDGDTWDATSEDPSGLVAAPPMRRGQCCPLGIAGFIGWNEVAFFSPDGRRISVQAHFQGEERWEDQQVLEAAPPGTRCVWMDGSQMGPAGFAVTMTCRSGPGAGDSVYEGDAYAFAVSRDLRTWESFYVSDVVSEPILDEDQGIQVTGRPFTTWSPDDGIERLDLPQPAGTVVARTEAGDHVRIGVDDGPDGCTVQVVVAEDGDEEWSDPVPGSYTVGPRQRCRLDYVNTSGTDGVRATLESRRATRAIVVERTDDGWRLSEDGERG